ncbi:N5-carboxyaminoimidazole ribonucleotide mutase [uncultured Ruminococcus sp.]|uniref:nickel pincer cofactor biosynthesis protein LarB n=1 Tax=Massiliimalia timonensis TaxID=1987501 RepID=UPI000821E83D|nr:nickel pincer cofactor biosynthesis protein LarB [Massiliimalia timonensis]SCH02134.1 N5-carboxyaminoimidazole ribonucleotide mutase [uncultured Clostridium sp.]SCH98013.1 N5-carboxyaminoimidazole ribonucleotide mutase [uncultured Ruminococcus sp.]
MDVEKLLQQVKEGTVSIEQAQQALKSLPYEDLGFARIDHHRKLRTGFGEVIFCKGKTKEQVAVIFDRLAARDTSVLATKATKEQYEAVLAVCPQAEYQENGGLITLIREQPQYIGEVAVCTAGTADIPVAEESAATAAFFGANVKRYYDVGVAGIHRLFDKLPEIERANVVIAVAGMEGALAGVLAGMIDKPVIAVPTSVGYGANFHGLSALLTMLNSCADGISVVNIDNGYGAGYLGAQINRLVTGKGEE